MSRSGRVGRRCDGIWQFCLEGVWPFLLPHNGHRGETGVFPHGGKAGQDDTVHVAGGFDIG